MSSFRRFRAWVLLLTVGLLVMSGCKSQNQDKSGTAQRSIEGRWEIDLDALQRSQEFLKEPEAKQEAILGIMTKMAKSMVFNITDEHIIVGSDKKEEATPYRVEKKEKEEWILITFPKQGQPEENRVRFTGDGLILVGKNTEFALKRQKLGTETGGKPK